MHHRRDDEVKEKVKKSVQELSNESKAHTYMNYISCNLDQVHKKYMHTVVYAWFNMRQYTHTFI